MEQIPVIKFSHKYNKLCKCFLDGDKKAVLLQTLMVDYHNLNAEFIEYDTSFDGGNYELPVTELILLIYKSEKTNRIFTTLRRYTLPKFGYYKRMQGRLFDVEFVNC